jgi:hypothetical protein
MLLFSRAVALHDDCFCFPRQMVVFKPDEIHLANDSTLSTTESYVRCTYVRTYVGTTRTG